MGKHALPGRGPAEDRLPQRGGSRGVTRLIRTLWKSSNEAVRASVLRAILLPVGALALLVTTRVTIEAVGPIAYGFISLVTALPYLVPISDLGLGAAITAEVARYGWIRPYSTRLLIRVGSLLSIIWLSAVGLSLAFALAGAFGKILGTSVAHVEALSFAAVAMYGLTIPLSIGMRVLLGMHRQSQSTVLQALTPVYGVIALLTLKTFVVLNSALIIVTLCSAPLVAAASQCALAARIVKRIPSGKVRNADAPLIMSTRSVMSAALPMTVMSIALPIALQSDRVVLSHLRGSADVSAYSVVAVVYGSLAGVVAAGGVALWPLFIRVGNSGANLLLTLRANARTFGTGGLIGAIALCIIGPLVVRILSADRVASGRSLYVAFGVLLLITAAQYPPSMYLLAANDLKFCAVLSSVMVVANIALSIVFTKFFGIAGPVLGSAVATLSITTVPFWIRSVRHAKLASLDLRSGINGGSN